MMRNSRSAAMENSNVKVLLAVLATLAAVGLSVTNPNDLSIIQQFRDGLENPELLGWPSTGDDPCGPPSWKHLFCENSRVTQIQLQNMNLIGTLPQNLNHLEMLHDLGLQKNKFSGHLPSFSGLSNLRHAYLDYNGFHSIPADFFDGLTSLEVLALDNIDLNATTGWSFPNSLQDSAQLTNLTCMSCNLKGPLPDFLGSMQSLQVLKLSNNQLSGQIPATFKGMSLQILWLNNQQGGGMTGGIDLVTTMEPLSSLWLHGNQFTGKIPDGIGNLTLLKDLNLNGNRLSGLVPDSLVNMELDNLDLNNNQLMGPIPKFKATKATCLSNAFCQTTPGFACAPQVMALIEFLGGFNYPSRLVSSWNGNNPCAGMWLGLSCDSNGNVIRITMPKLNLTGTLNPSVAKLDSLSQINLANNEVNGPIPEDWTSLKLLKSLDLSNNNISYPLPKFSSTVKLVLDGNPLLSENQSTTSPPAPGGSPPTPGGSPPTPRGSHPAPGGSPEGSISPPNSPSNPSNRSDFSVGGTKKNHMTAILLAIVVPVAFLALLAIFVSIYCCKKKRGTYQAQSSLVIHPRDPSDSDNAVKIVVANNTTNRSASTLTGSGSASRTSSAFGGESHVIESGNLVISVQVLRNVTKNFSPDKELGRGGFGVVYKGEFDDGTEIAVKRMEASVINGKALDEFQAEIAVLSKVRHRHLVSLLGYSIEGYERLLVYEYMPQGALSRHLFRWKSFKLEPLSWKKRLVIALDVARGMEYLHCMAHQSFIHRDLKSSNILLGDDFRAKISDFGLVKLAPDGEKSLVTRLAGTFGYLAPEYAVTGRVTTKADVFSFGVVLMEILTGLMALDEDRPEESQYLAAWFWHIKSDKEKLRAAIDPTLEVNDKTFESISIIADLAGHCTAREPSQRPDMGHAVNVLVPLVEKWKPLGDDTEDYCGVDYSLPLNQMVKVWQEAEGKEISYLEDSKGSIPARPTGFAESFTSVDAR